MEQMKKFPNGLLCLSGIPGSKMKLMGNEFLVMCPYEKNHRVLNHGFCNHLRKCRGNYERAKESKGEIPAKIACSFNSNHKFYPPERSYHEHNCEDKINLLKRPFTITPPNSQVIYYENGEPVECAGQLKGKIGWTRGAAAASGGGGSPKVSRRNENEAAFDMALALETPHKDSDMPSAGIGGIATTLMKRLDLNADQGIPHILSQTMDPDSFGFVHRRRHIPRRFRLPEEPKVPFPKGAGAAGAVDDDDDWNLPPAKGNGPKFDWLEHQFNLKGPLRIYPPGLTKAERRKFDFENTERLKYEEGIFVEENLEAQGPNK